MKVKGLAVCMRFVLEQVEIWALAIHVNELP